MNNLDNPNIHAQVLDLWHNSDRTVIDIARSFHVSVNSLYNTFGTRGKRRDKYSDEYIIERYKELGTINLVNKELGVCRMRISRIIHKHGLKVVKSAGLKEKKKMEERQLNTFKWERKEETDYWKLPGFEIKTMSYMKTPVLH